MRFRLLFAFVATMSACLFPSVGDLNAPDDASAVEEAAADVSANDVVIDSKSPLDASDAKAVSDASDADVVDSSAPPAPIAYVQGQANDFGAGNTALLALPNVAVHHSLIVCATLDANGTMSVVDTFGSTFTQFVSFDSTSVGGPTRTVIVAAFDVVAGNDTITITTTTTHTDFETWAFEYAGLTAFDVKSSAQGTSQGTDVMASGFATTTHANDLIFACGTDGIASAGTNFTLRSGFESDLVEDRIVSTAGAYQATGTTTTGPGWQISMAAFKGF